MLSSSAALGFAYVRQIMTAADVALEVYNAQMKLEEMNKRFEMVGFTVLGYGDFYDAFNGLIRRIMPDEFGVRLDSETLLKEFQDEIGESSHTL